MIFAGLDVGTTVTRLILFDERGRVLASSYRDYPLIIRGDHLEVSPLALWEAVCEVCGEAAGKVRGDPIDAIGVSAMGDTLIVADTSLNPVGNAILAFDTRSKGACDELVGRIGFDAWYSATGMPAHSMATATKVAWYVKENREVENLRFMCAEDFVIGRLTGCPVMSWSTAARTMLFHTGKKEWWGDILEAIGIRPHALSSVEPSATVVGTIAPGIADTCGVGPRTLIVTGGHDQVCSAVGSGAVRDGILSDNTGTFETISAAIAGDRKTRIDMTTLAAHNLALYPHGPKDLWSAFAWFNAGSLVNWCRDTFFSGEAEAEDADVFEKMFEGIPEGPAMVRVLPHFTGAGTPWLDSDALGAFVGLNLSTTRYDILKGVLEGVGYDLLLNLRGMEEAGVTVERIRATGGGTRSHKWNQLKADMTGKEVTVVENPEASALGAAICAGVASSAFGTFEEAADAMVSAGRTYTPNPGLHDAYREGLVRYRELNGIVNPFSGRVRGKGSTD